MKTIFASLVFVAGVLAQNFMINTPTNAVVCQPLLLSWTGGTPPYFLSILPGGQPSAPALVDLGRQDGNSVTWTVNQPQGSSLGLTLRDSNGQIAQSAPFTVNGGSDASCVGQNPSTSAGGSAPAPTGGATTPASTSAAGATTPATTSAATPPATTAPASSPAATSRPASSAAASSVSRSSAAASSTPSSAASANFAQVGAAGVVGAALAALLV